MHRSSLLDEIFERRIASGEVVTQEELDDCERFCRDDNIDLCIAKVAHPAIKRIQPMEDLGYRLMGTTLHFIKKVRSPFPLYEGPEIILRPAQPSEFDYTMDCATRAFGSGFSHDHYYVDERLKLEPCIELCRRYVRESWNSEQGQILIGERIGVAKPLGFVTVRRNSETEWEVLLGAFPSLPLGDVRMICSKMVLFAREHSVRTLKISTELSNLSMQRVLTQTGFHVSSAHYTLHKWFC